MDEDDEDEDTCALRHFRFPTLHSKHNPQDRWYPRMRQPG